MDSFTVYRFSMAKRMQLINSMGKRREAAESRMAALRRMTLTPAIGIAVPSRHKRWNHRWLHEKGADAKRGARQDQLRWPAQPRCGDERTGHADKREVGRWPNNRVENRPLSFRRRERAMFPFRRIRRLQKFSCVHGVEIYVQPRPSKFRSVATPLKLWSVFLQLPTSAYAPRGHILVVARS